jgi:hypothetical protein
LRAAVPFRRAQRLSSAYFFTSFAWATAGNLAER